MKVLQILPRVPPAVCGIGDYTWGIARRLRDEHDIHSSFLSAGTSWTKPEGETEFPVFRLPELTSQALVSFVTSQVDEFQAIVLHMSPYGYQKRAVPLWLANGWRRVSKMKVRPRMITMFHELYASGPPTSSAFWLQPLQKHVLRVVAQASDGLRTNRQPYADWLLSLSGLKASEVAVMPVYSNFGEPVVLPPLSARAPAMAMFAWGIHSGESLAALMEKACAHCRSFGLHTLHLIGGKDRVLSVPPGIELVRHGFLEAGAISNLLSSCRMAYTAYSAEHFGKSTLMAAFAAHGLAVIVQGRQASLPDDLCDGINVLNESALSLGGASAPDVSQLEILGAALRRWYDQHSLQRNAESYATQIQQVLDKERSS